MQHLRCALIGVPVQSGTSQEGCLMGPAAYRTAGLGRIFQELGHSVLDWGDVAVKPTKDSTHPNSSIHDLNETVGWAQAISDAAFEAAKPAICRYSWAGITA